MTSPPAPTHVSSIPVPHSNKQNRPDNMAASSSRSPLSTSHRLQPYLRRPSVDTPSFECSLPGGVAHNTSSRDRERFYLPPPNSGTPLSIPSEQGPSWTTRPPPDLQQGGEVQLDAAKRPALGLNFPPLAPFSPAASPPSTLYGSLRSPLGRGADPVLQASANVFMPLANLRPSYDHTPHPFRTPGPIPGSSPRAELPSPPLRSVREVTGSSSAMHTLSPERFAPSGRARSHSAASAASRYAGQSVSSEDAEPGAGPIVIAGQTRRIAHLMSEQKRRESINTGFDALRAALPGTVITDSKAIVLRRAVSHITHLESLLRKAGISVSTPAREARAEDVEMLDADDDQTSADFTRQRSPDATDELKKGWEEQRVEDVNQAMHDNQN